MHIAIIGAIIFPQLLGEVHPSDMVAELDDVSGNTVAHLVAAAGNTEVFKVCYYTPRCNIIVIPNDMGLCNN